MEEGKGRICVTGGTGFVASLTIKRLLQEGYSVNTTIRAAPGGAKKDVSFLTNLPGASQKLKIFNADLTTPESFGPAIEGCTGVFHIASIYDWEGIDVDEMTKKQIDGVIGILKACKNSKTVKRVIYTGDIASTAYSGKKFENIDESYWSDVNYLHKMKPFGWTSYVIQTLTEKAVHEFAEQHGLDVVFLLLPLVIGPFICSKFPISIELLTPFWHGVPQGDLFYGFPIAHVDDVARAYIFLFEHPNAKGRYICSISGRTINLQEIAELVRAKFPEFKIPSREMLKEMKGKEYPTLSSKKLMDTGFEFKYGIEEAIEQAIQCSKEKGYL